jgi:hypothetical protein
MLTFHRAACALAGLEPATDPVLLEAIGERQRQLGRRFPDALTEWWAVPGGLDVLGGAQGDRPCQAAELGAPEPWGDGEHDFLARGLLVVAREQQGVCHWAVPLDEGPDPKVLIEVDGAPGEPTWREHAPSVTAWVAACAWDKAAFDLPLGLTAQDDPLAEADLRLLEREFNSGPTTFGWPGETVWRFEWQDQRVLVWAAADGSDWWLLAETAEALGDLAGTLWSCGGLARSLSAVQLDEDDEDGAAESTVLAELRGRRSG